MNAESPPARDPIKRVLVIRYSQTGQLNRLADSILAPLQADARFAVRIEVLRPLRPFPFPWSFFRFLDAFPESAHLAPAALEPLGLTGDEDFDLVILPYQVWFLAPSQPITAFLKHPIAQRVLRGRPVVSVIACRNMWLSAHEKMLGLLDQAGARLIDNVVLTDPGPTLATFITTPRWLLSGKRAGFWGLPAAGLSDAQIKAAQRFGRALREAMLNDAEKGEPPLLAGLGAVHVDARLYFSERAGTRSFFVWGRLLRAAGSAGSVQRVPLLVLYVVFLVVMIVTLVPTSLALQALLRPLMRARLSRIEARFERPSGSSQERSHRYED
jgi:hypothetical protein